MQNSPDIAVVEDERELRNDLVEFLQLRGFSARGFASAESFLKACTERDFELVILDILLPGMDGFQAAHLLREKGLGENYKAGIIMLTSLDGEADQVTGLMEGADAYLVKNTSLEIIEATCRSVLRRIRDLTQLQSHVWHLSVKGLSLTAPNGKQMTLSHGETLFLQCLLKQAGTSITREIILDLLGKADTLSNLRNLDNYASRLRRKTLKQLGEEIPIRSSYNNGYIFASEGFIE